MLSISELPSAPPPAQLDPQWYWWGCVQTWGWQHFPPAQCKVLEASWRSGHSSVRVGSDQRAVDLGTMSQQRASEIVPIRRQSDNNSKLLRWVWWNDNHESPPIGWRPMQRADDESGEDLCKLLERSLASGAPKVRLRMHGDREIDLVNYKQTAIHPDGRPMLDTHGRRRDRAIARQVVRPALPGGLVLQRALAAHLLTTARELQPAAEAARLPAAGSPEAGMEADSDVPLAKRRRSGGEVEEEPTGTAAATQVIPSTIPSASTSTIAVPSAALDAFSANGMVPPGLRPFASTGAASRHPMPDTAREPMPQLRRAVSAPTAHVSRVMHGLDAGAEMGGGGSSSTSSDSIPHLHPPTCLACPTCGALQPASPRQRALGVPTTALGSATALDVNPTALEELGPFEFGPVNFSSLGLRVSFDQVIARSFVGLHANAHLGAPTSPQVIARSFVEDAPMLGGAYMLDIPGVPTHVATGAVSGKHFMTLPQELKRQLGIPDRASEYAFVYPLPAEARDVVISALQRQAGRPRDLDCFSLARMDCFFAESLLSAGGFVYFEAKPQYEAEVAPGTWEPISDPHRNAEIAKLCELGDEQRTHHLYVSEQRLFRAERLPDSLAIVEVELPAPLGTRTSAGGGGGGGGGGMGRGAGDEAVPAGASISSSEIREIRREVRPIEPICAVKCLWPSREQRGLCFRKLSLDEPLQARTNWLAPHGLAGVSVHHKVTLDLLKAKGVRCFFWVKPYEPLGTGLDDGRRWPHGGFAYLYDDNHAEKDVVFVVRGLGDAPEPPTTFYAAPTLRPPIEEWMRRGLMQIGAALSASTARPSRGPHWKRVTFEGGSTWDVRPLGSGFLVNAAHSLVFTCEHVRSAAQRIVDILGDEAHQHGAGSGAGEHDVSSRACLVASLYVGGETDWHTSWVVEALAHTNDWNTANLDPSTKRPRPSTGALLLPADVADAAVLRAVRKLGGRGPSPAETPLISTRCFTLARTPPPEPLVLGQRLFSLGYPLGGGDTPTPTFGEYVGPHHDEHGNWLKFQGLVMPGHSGGPVLDERGVVVAWNVRNLASPYSTPSYQTAAGLNELRSIAEGFAVIDAAEARLVNT